MKKLRKNRFGVPVYTLRNHYRCVLSSLSAACDKLLSYGDAGDLTEDLLKYYLWTIEDCVNELKNCKALKCSIDKPSLCITHTIYNFGHTGKDVTISSDLDKNVTFDVSDTDPSVLPF